MRRIAHPRAITIKDGLGRPFFVRVLQRFVLLCVSAWCVSGLAQEVIYRCGQEYTNAPKDPSRCERLSEQAVTVISGLRTQQLVPAVALPAGQTPDETRTKAEPPRTVSERQIERDVQARTILAQELERVQKQHQNLLLTYNQSAPIKSAGEQSSPRQYQEREATLKAAIDRAERDIDSLQRELARRPAPVKVSKP
jgi:hypothetical protein